MDPKEPNPPQNPRIKIDLAQRHQRPTHLCGFARRAAPTPTRQQGFAPRAARRTARLQGNAPRAAPLRYSSTLNSGLGVTRGARFLTAASSRKHTAAASSTAVATAAAAAADAHAVHWAVAPSPASSLRFIPRPLALQRQANTPPPASALSLIPRPLAIRRPGDQQEVGEPMDLDDVVVPLPMELENEVVTEAGGHAQMLANAHPVTRYGSQNYGSERDQPSDANTRALPLSDALIQSMKKLTLTK